MTDFIILWKLLEVSQKFLERYHFTFADCPMVFEAISLTCSNDNLQMTDIWTLFLEFLNSEKLRKFSNRRISLKSSTVGFGRNNHENPTVWLVAVNLSKHKALKSI